MDFALGAAVLVAGGVELVVVGSTALALHHEQLEVHDLDVVISPSRANLMAVGPALTALGATRSDIPPLRALQEADLVTVITAHGQVDLMLEQGRRRFVELVARAMTVDICGVGVAVANRDDAWALRARFKDPFAFQ
jgi:hypothetical protein